MNAPESWRHRVDITHHLWVDSVVSCPHGSSPRPGESGTVAIATWNIRSGRGGGLEAACRALDQMGVGAAIITETKVMAGKHTRFSSKFRVRFVGTKRKAGGDSVAL